MKTLIKTLTLGLLLTLGTLHAKTLPKAQVPEPLKPWVDWVLYGEEQHNCPHAYNREERYCAWPAALKLELDDNQGQFSQHWQVQIASWVRLPGNAQQWPHDVEVDSIAAVVVNHNGFPAVKLPPGEHEISGGFQWDSIPESLTIPPNTGLIQISRNGILIDSPRINQQGQLWLDRASRETDTQDALDVQVYRKIQDSHPMQIQTRLILHAAGRSRDVLFPGLQLAGFTPLQLKSTLPARINQQGDLQVQVRPGNWEINLLSYRAEMVNELTLPAPQPPLPKQEVWVFQADPSIRLSEISGVPAVDSRQTRLPEEWQAYPAYLLDAGKTMKLKTLQRGSASPEPNRLRLHRAMWMDFDGNGFTIQDQIDGTMTRGWRLMSSPQLKLGSVSMDGEPQFITTLNGKEQGVEVRRGRINMEATSRYTQSRAVLPVNGWQHDLQAVDTQLYLPPGWKLFSAQGADNVPNSWLQSWTLLDLFMVLIIAIAIGRLWDWKWGAFALLSLALVWHEPGAPKYIWLNLIAAIALLKVLPEGLMKKLLWWYRNATLLALLLIVLPFIVNEVRNGLYPQLGLYADYENVSPVSGFATNAALEPEAPAPYDSGMLQSSPRIMMKKKYRAEEDKILSYDSTPRQQANQMVDPNANIQTGPGLPSWDWQPVYFSWNSPVSEEQTLKLTLLSPRINMLLNFLRVILLLLLIARLLKVVSNTMQTGKPPKPPRRPRHRFAKTAALVLLPGILLLLASNSSHAEIIEKAPASSAPAVPQTGSVFPDAEMLRTLQQRLLGEEECLPECAQIEAMRVELSPQLLTLYLKIHSAADVAVPLPGGSEQWRPERVLLEDQPAKALSRDGNGTLWMLVPKGIQNIVMQGRLPHQPQVQLSLPLQPRYVEWEGEGWSVEGIRENHRPTSTLQLIRKQDETQANSEDESADSNYLPPLLKVERTLHLGLDWLIDTRITRLSPPGTPVSMKIPLLENESVLSNAYSIEDGKLLINMSSTQRSLAWQSQLDVSDSLQLEASRTPGLIESWKLDISPVWHVNISGIPAMHQTNQGTTWLPQWKPWPGEKIKLAISRPKGISGRTLTIERSILSTTVGKRMRETTLTLQIRSSRGGQHTITLPEQAELISVNINNKIQPVRQQQRLVSLPIVPGEQRIQVNWRVDKAITTRLNILPVNIGIDSVNNSIYLNLSRDRWVLFTHGPVMGPAVLFWGVLLVILTGSVILGKLKNSPLKIWQWFLLGAGLSLATPLMIIVVAGWLLALNYRPRLQAVTSRAVFNTAQVLLIILTLIALGSLMVALQQGLLGWPEMQISGNGSTAYHLHWYQDRITAELPQPWVISVPLLAYRILMLLWALWLAFSLINWLRTGWENFTTGGMWRPGEKTKKTKKGKKAGNEVIDANEAKAEV